MSFSAPMADERVLDVQLTEDTLIVSLRDGRIISVPLVWFPKIVKCFAGATQELGGRRRGIWDSLA